ncbi:hypothetical protein PROFUN_13930 [Planoprotostelium fungivorum]|uniref:Uncharacterized protein n=1 Tax=Planoprotostelium fungivorum TaxID=1890364 RepID=A0A2P6N2E5_9EUKA|nr:hypothetical protein PROFUN_13930 [Planoprotostelium fungivorum]
MYKQSKLQFSTKMQCNATHPHGWVVVGGSCRMRGSTAYSEPRRHTKTHEDTKDETMITNEERGHEKDGCSPRLSQSPIYLNMHNEVCLWWDLRRRKNSGKSHFIPGLRRLIQQISNTMLMKRGLVVLFALSLLLLHTNANEVSCGLACWLSKAQVKIPDQNQTYPYATVEIKDVQCSSIHLNDLFSREDNDTLHFGVGGVGIECSAYWSFVANQSYLGFPLSDYGQIQFGLDPSQSNMNLSLQFYRNSTTHLVDHIDLQDCTTRLFIKPILTSGGYISELLEILSGTYTPLLNMVIDFQLCPIAKDIVSNQLTAAYKNVGTVFGKPNEPAPAPLIEVKEQLCNLSSSPLLALGNLFAADHNPKNPFGFNGLFNFMTHETGTLNLTNLLEKEPSYSQIKLDVPDKASVNVQVLSASVSELNQWKKVDLMEPLSYYRRHQNNSHYLNDYNSTSLVDSMLISDMVLEELKVYVTVSLEVNVTDPMISQTEPLRDELNLYVSVSDLHIHADVLALVLQKNIEQLTGDSLQDPKELMKVLNSVNVTYISTDFKLNSIHVSSVHMDWEAGVVQLFNDIIHISLKRILPQILNSAMGSIAREQINDMIQEILHPKEEKAISRAEVEKDNKTEDGTHHKDLKTHPETVGVDVFWSVFGFVLMVVVFLFLSVMSTMLHKRYYEEDQNDYVKLSHLSVQADDVSEKAVWGRSLHQHPSVHWFTRSLVLALLCLNIAMYISAHSSQSADFRIILQVEEKTYVIPSVYKYSIIDNIENMWKAGIQWISMIIVVALGFLPYARLCFLISAWCLPRRSTWLNIMVRMSNDMGKFTFADTFICTILAEVLYFKASAPASERVVEGSVQMSAFLIPMWGFYVYLLATILSILLNHIILSSYNRVHAEESGLIDKDMSGIVQLKESIHHMLRKHEHVSTRAKIDLLLNLLVVASCVLMAVGVFLPSFKFQSEGVFRAFRESIGQKTLLEVSHISHLFNLPNYSINPGHFTLPILQVIYSVTFLVPFLFLILLLFIWFVPLRAKARNTMSYIVLINSAWTGIEIFTLTAVIAVFAVGPFSAYMVAPQCDPYQPIFDVVFGGMKCYDVHAYFGSLSPVVFTGCVLFFIVVKMVLFIMNHVFKKDEVMGDTSSYKPLASDDSPY